MGGEDSGSGWGCSDGHRYHVLAGSGVEVFPSQLSDTGEKLSGTLAEPSQPAGGSGRLCSPSLTSDSQAGCSPPTHLLEMEQVPGAGVCKGRRVGVEKGGTCQS